MWTREQKGIKPDAKDDISFESIVPSWSHFAMVTLLQHGKIKHIVSQNIDGLHIKSGIKWPDQLSELHGNVFKERCSSGGGCGATYFRSFDVRGVGFQKTGRQCEKCGESLHDVASFQQFLERLQPLLIHLGQLLDWNDPLDDFEEALKHSSRADLSICVGTSLKVQPANTLPGMAKTFAIVNFQKTPQDTDAALLLHWDCQGYLKILFVQYSLYLYKYCKMLYTVLLNT